MLKRAVKKIFRLIGVDIRKYENKNDPFFWLKKHNISTVIDVGANTGQFATEIRRALPLARIISFEPIKECYDQLNANFKGDNNFTALNMALGSEPAKVSMNKSSYTPSSSLLPMADIHKKMFPHTKDQTTELVEVKTMDEVLSKLDLKPEILIKIDVQGYEDKVIVGGPETFKKARVAIIENSFSKFYEGQPLFDDIYRKMTGLGFTYQSSLHQKKDASGEILFEDSIFIRKK